MIHSSRIFKLNQFPLKSGPVVYWMSRDQRVNDNWALLYAQELALLLRQPLFVIFCVSESYAETSKQHYQFMLEGLKEAAQKFEMLKIPFFLLVGTPPVTLPVFLEQNSIGSIVTDFNPLKINRLWKNRLLQNINIPVYEVDTHNIVPCRIASLKQEFAAYTLRPKLRRLLPECLEEFSKPVVHPFQAEKNKISNRNNFESPPGINLQSANYQWIRPGEDAANKAAEEFVHRGLHNYHKDRNDPLKNGQSGLSPYLHFGQLSAQRLALMIQQTDQDVSSSVDFLEELIVRRELSDNYCFYNEHYDSFEGFPAWVKKTLNDHRADPRPYLYTTKIFEHAETDDKLWNAAQKEMMVTGKMHGYIRMYWAKKILEWTSCPEEAIATAIYLNDKYSLDGRDPNGYTGIAWAIGGVHDRAWSERPVFGKIRYMNATGCRRKFDVNTYIRKFKELKV